MKKRLLWIGVILLFCFGVLLVTVQNQRMAEIPSVSHFVPTSKDWIITFTEEMNPDSFNEKTVSITDENNQKVNITKVWNDTYTSLTLQAPETGYEIDQKYNILISKTVQTENGKNLSKTLQHSFTAVSDTPSIKDKEQLITLLKERMEQEELSTMERSDITTEMSVSDSATEEASTFSTTNTQVAGIDEGDIIKNNGEFIYFLRENDIIIAPSHHQNNKQVKKIEEENFTPTELYLKDNMLISIGYSYEQDQHADEGIAIYPPISEKTMVVIYDITDQSTPEKVREIVIDGNLSASRLSDDYLYLVGSDYPPYQIMEDPQAEARPSIKDTANSEDAKPIDYQDMYYFPDNDTSNYLLLTSIDLTNMKKEAKTISYLGGAGIVYMSENQLYVAVAKPNQQQSSSTGRDLSGERSMGMDTEIFQFNIHDGKIDYHTSEIVNGTLINQFAMDQRDEIFRVATTKESESDNQLSANNLYTYDNDLNLLGKLEGLAEGEQIYSVRFMDDVAYLVTFEQIDPLFVIDLEDPAKPTVLGELKIPGFSNYLHPLDNNHLIGFGQHTKLIRNEEDSSNPQVTIDGLKMSLFDVSDPANPIEKDSEIIGEGGSYSELNYNHKVLFHHPDRNLYGFPAVLYDTKTIQQGDASYEADSFAYEGAFLYKITAEEGIALYDTITHQQTQEQEHPKWESEIKRIISIGDFLYTFSNDQYSIYDLNDNQIIETVDLPQQSKRY